MSYEHHAVTVLHQGMFADETKPASEYAVTQQNT